MKRNHVSIPLVSVFFSLLLSACGTGDAEVVYSDQTRALQLVDSIQIQESDDRFIGELVGADVERDPLRIYVVDRKMRRVAVVAGDGAIARFIGKEGRGPGELGRPVFVSVIGGRIVVALRENVSLRGRRVNLFPPEWSHSAGFCQSQRRVLCSDGVLSV